jgi:Ca-activated chloride channel family protein
MKFAFWQALLVIPVILLLLPWWLRRNRPPRLVLPFSLPTAVRAVASGWPIHVTKALGLCLLLVALARPQSSFKQTERTVSGVDITIAMDVSRSMDIQDMGDRSRLEIAKDTMRSFIQGRQNDRIGFVIFSGEPVTLAPPTLDYEILLRQLREVRTGALKDGTAIGDGLALAVNRMRNSTAKSRIIILLTDGDNNTGQVDPATSGELAAGFGIRVYTIAIGREGRVKMPVTQPNLFGQMVTTHVWMDSSINPELLQTIAKTSGGRFYRVDEETALKEVFREIDLLEKTEIKTHEKIRFEERFYQPLLLGLLLLLASLLAGLFLKRTLP